MQTSFITRGTTLRVHAIIEDRPLCGGGYRARSIQWQQDIGPVNCRACLKILNSLSRGNGPAAPVLQAPSADLLVGAAVPAVPAESLPAKNANQTKMKTLKITSIESLDAAVAEAVRLKNQRTLARAEKDREVISVEKEHTARILRIEDEIAAVEGMIAEYCVANRANLFCDRKSRETPLAEFGFELTPPRVEPSSRKLKWKDVVARLLRLSWGKAYVRQPEPVPDKQALLSDREKLTTEQLIAAGIQFCQDEQFFLRPKPESAQE